MIAPFWSKYTIMMQKNEYKWIRQSLYRFISLLPFVAIALYVMVILFEPLAQIWLQTKLDYKAGLISCMAVYTFVSVWNSIYATVMNGMGRVNLQLICSIVSAGLNIPLSIYLAQNKGLGVTGVAAATVICMVIASIPLTIAVHAELNRLVKLDKS